MLKALYFCKRRNLNKILDNVVARDEQDDLIDHFKEVGDTFLFNFFKLAHFSEKLLSAFKTVKIASTGQAKRDLRRKLEGEGGHKAISKILKGSRSQEIP